MEAGDLKRSVWVVMLLFSCLSLPAAAYIGSQQTNFRFQYPSVMTYANLLIASGCCWGALFLGYFLWGVNGAMQRVRNIIIAAALLGLAYVAALPPVILLHTGPVPDTFASWLMVALGALLGVLLVGLLWLLQRVLNAHERRRR